MPRCHTQRTPLLPVIGDREGNPLCVVGRKALCAAGRRPCRPEFPVATPQGTKVPDVAWITGDRREEMRTTGDPPTLAPEICVEVMFESNDWEEMKTTTDLYRKAGAEEVWIMGAEGTVRFFAEDEMDGSEIVPDFPSSV